MSAKGIFSNFGLPDRAYHVAQNVLDKTPHFAGKGHVSETLAVHGIPHTMLSFHITKTGQPGHGRTTGDRWLFYIFLSAPVAWQLHIGGRLARRASFVTGALPVDYCR